MSYKIERDAIYMSYSDFLLLQQDKLPGFSKNGLSNVTEKVKISKKHKVPLTTWYFNVNGVNRQIFIKGSWC